jgi:hypothetical protein
VVVGLLQCKLRVGELVRELQVLAFELVTLPLEPHHLLVQVLQLSRRVSAVAGAAAVGRRRPSATAVLLLAAA